MFVLNILSVFTSSDWCEKLEGDERKYRPVQTYTADDGDRLIQLSRKATSHFLISIPGSYEMSEVPSPWFYSTDLWPWKGSTCLHTCSHIVLWFLQMCSIHSWWCYCLHKSWPSLGKQLQTVLEFICFSLFATSRVSCHFQVIKEAPVVTAYDLPVSHY